MAIDPARLTPTGLVRLANSTPLGAVLTAALLRKQMDEAGLRIGDGQRVHLVRYVRWLAQKYEDLRSRTEFKRSRTTQEIAQLFDVDDSTVRKWGLSGCPNSKGKSGNKWNEAEVAGWLRRHGLLGAIGTAETDPSTADARRRKELALARRYELESDVMLEKVHDGAECQRAMVALVTEARNSLLELPRVLAGQLVGLDAAGMESVLDQRIRETLEELSRRGRTKEHRDGSEQIDKQDTSGMDADDQDQAVPVGGTEPAPLEGAEFPSGPMAE
jgi:phage terminase Nu1 subunit (DNA packaging protein)